MIPWIQVYSNLIKHPKTTNLADELSLTSKDASPNAVAAGMLVSLWLWAAQNATDGDLGGCSDRAIAEAAEYKKKPADFVAALIKTKWLDKDRKLHDWDEYATLLHDLDERQRQKTRERVQRHRLKKKAAGNTDGAPGCNAPGNVTDTASNAPTIPNPTIPNHNISGNISVTNKVPTAEGAPAYGNPFTVFWDAYPKKSSKQREEAWAAWKKLNPNPDGVAHIMAQLAAWKKSEQWLEQDGRFAPRAADFLDPEGDYLRKVPTPAKQGIPNGASGELGEAEMEAIQRVLRESEGGNSNENYP